MGKIGILRYGTDNDFMFVAENEHGNILQNLAFYHQNTSSCIGWDGPSKKTYSHAQITDGGRVLRYDNAVIFSGDDVFPVFDITPDVYEEIFDHSDDAGKILMVSRERLERGEEPTMFGWFPRKGRMARWFPWELVKFAYRETIEADYKMIKEQLEEHPPRAETLEQNRALAAAIDAGFVESFINRRPRVVSHGAIAMSQLLSD